MVAPLKTALASHKNRDIYKMDEIIEVVETAKDLTFETHNNMIRDYFPGKENGGIHEFNLVSIFIESLKRINGFDNVSAWSEVLYLKSKSNRPARLDAAIKLKDKDSLLLIEAKRIRQGKTKGKLNSKIALKSILKDSKRLSKIDNTEPVILTSNSKKIYKVLLASMWYSEKQHMIDAREKWISKEAFNKDWSNCFVFESKDVCDSEKFLKILVAIDGPYQIQQ